MAPIYDLLDLAEIQFKSRLRPKLFEGLSGTILDAGVGTGRNMAFYPSGARLVGIDLSPGMLSRARVRRATLGVEASLIAMDLGRIGFRDESFDAAVATFVFSSLDDAQQRAALTELARVLKPKGEIRLLDYQFSERPMRRLYMRLWSYWDSVAYGASFDRPPERYMEAAGLEITRREFVHKDMVKLIVARRRP